MISLLTVKHRIYLVSIERRSLEFPFLCKTWQSACTPPLVYLVSKERRSLEFPSLYGTWQSACTPP